MMMILIAIVALTLMIVISDLIITIVTVETADSMASVDAETILGFY